MAQPTEAAIALLRKNPETAAQFDEVFGKGASAQFVKAPAEQPGILSKVGAVASDIAGGIAEAPGAIARGVIGAVNETSDLAKSAADGIEDFSAAHGLDLGHIEVSREGVAWKPGKAEGNNIRVPEAVTPAQRDTVTGSLIEGVSQFTTGMLGAGKFLKAFGIGGATTTAGKFAMTAGKGAIADATVFDPHAARLSNLMEENPSLSNPVTSFLAAKDSDSEAEGRLKNALEGFLVGTALEGFVHSVKAIKLARKGDLKGAADAADAAEKAHTAEAPKPAREFPEGDSRNDPAALTIGPEAPKAEADTVTLYRGEPAAGAMEDGISYDSRETGRWFSHTEDAAKAYAGEGGKVYKVEIPKAELEAASEKYRAASSGEERLLTQEWASKKVDANAASAPAERDVMRVATPPGGEPAFRLDDAEIEQYRKNLDSRFTMGGQDMSDAGQHFNFDKIRTDDDIKAAVNAMANVVDKHLDGVRGGDADGVRSWDEVRKNADMIAEITGGDPRVMLQHLTTLGAHTKHLDSMTKAYGDMLVTMSAHSDRLAQMLSDGTPGKYGSMDKLKAAYAQSTNLLANTYAQVKGVQTNVARAMNASKIYRDVNPAVKEGLEQLDPADDMLLMTTAQRQAAASRGANDPLAAAASTRKLLEGSKFSKALSVHNEYWFNAVLSGVKTHVINVTGNTVKAVFMPAERMVAGLLSRNHPQFLEGAYQYVGITKALKDSFAMAGKAFNVADNILDPHKQAYEGVSRQAITATNFGLEQVDSIAPLVNGIGTVVRLPSRFLMAEDEFFKQINFRSRTYAQAMREGVEQGLDPKATAELVERRMAEAFDPNGGINLVDNDGRTVASRVAALQQAREGTYTQPLEHGMGRWIEEGAQAHPFIRVIMPFVRVPTNLMRDVWQHTPGIGMVQKQMREDLAAGGERASMAMAKQATGAALWTVAVGFALEGGITGNGPTGPQARKAWLLQNQPYSFVSTNPETGEKTFVAYNRLDPLFTPFGLAADFANIAGELDSSSLDEFARGATLAIVNNLASKTYLQGLVQTVGILQDDRGSKLQAFLEQRAASYIPSAAGIANADPHMREVRTVLDAMAAKVPGYSQTLPPRRDVLGEIVNVPMGYPFNQINPFVVKSAGADPVREEMARLADSDAGIRFPMPPTKMEGLDLSQVKNDEGVSAYDRWMQNIGELTLGGRTLHEKLNDTVASTAYQNSADGNGIYKKSRKVDLIQRDLERYRDRALHNTLNEFPELKQALRDFKRGSKRVRAGQAPGNDPFSVLNQ